MARIVLTTFGSLGDLHPFLAVGAELVARGHAAVLATHEEYRTRIEGAGIAFRPVRPHFADFESEPDFMRKAMAERGGSRYIATRLVIPHLRASFDDLLAACEGADGLVSHLLSFSAPLVAERLGLPRALAVLQPAALFSAHDPPVDPNLPGSARLRALGPWVWRPLWAMARVSSRGWFRPVDALRREVGLPRASGHPLFDAFSDRLNLALFSSVLARPRPDWPPKTVVTGFPLHDRDETGGGLPEALRRFVDAGPPPLVFTLGSSGVWDPGAFFREGAEAARALGMRAVLLVGAEGERVLPSLPEGVVAVAYAPHSELFPRAEALIHQGGVGTTGQALRSGRPSLIVPFSHDQHDNAARCARLGVARVVRRREASAARLGRELSRLIADPAFTERARRIAERVRAENGAGTAADAIEGLLEGGTRAAASPGLDARSLAHVP